MAQNLDSMATNNLSCLVIQYAHVTPQSTHDKVLNLRHYHTIFVIVLGYRQDALFAQQVKIMVYPLN